MNEERKKRLDRVTTAEGFLELTDEDVAVIDERMESDRARRILAALLKMKRGRQLTQARIAKLIQSSQSRIAKAEAADSSVSLDLLFRANFAAGVSLEEIGRALMQKPHATVRRTKGVFRRRNTARPA
jgi:hypothetical protein